MNALGDDVDDSVKDVRRTRIRRVTAVSGMRTRSISGLVMVSLGVSLGTVALAQSPATQNKVESPTVKALTGLTVQEFEQEMQHFVQAVGVSCGGCHMPKGNFASDENPRKLRARQMIEMTKALNQQFFPDHTRAEGDSVLGRVTCYTCHQGELKPKAAP